MHGKGKNAATHRVWVLRHDRWQIVGGPKDAYEAIRLSRILYDGGEISVALRIGRRPGMRH